MKRLVLLILLSAISLNLSGCDRKNNELYRLLDTDKAEEIALGYMNEKYDKTFSVVGSQKDHEAGYVPASIQAFWCDVELTLEDSDNI